MLPILAITILAGCGPSEEELQQRQIEIDEQSTQKAVEMVDQYKTELAEKRITPYKLSELEDTFGNKYTEIRENIRKFNQGVLQLREDEITVYDLNKDISDYRLQLQDYHDLDTEKIPDDYYSFYKGFGEVAVDYINNIEQFAVHYQNQDAEGIGELAGLLSNNIRDLTDLEYSIYGTPLGDSILSKEVKERSRDKLNELCEIKVNGNNQEYLESIQLEDVNKNELSDEELIERREQEEEYAKLMAEYDEKVVGENKECRDNIMAERANYGSRIVMSEYDELEDELYQLLEDYNTRLDEEANEESTEGEVDSEVEGTEGEELPEDGLDLEEDMETEELEEDVE